MNQRKVLKEQIEGLGKEGLAGAKIGSFDRRLLILTEDTMDEHLRMQPAAIAYYGMLLRRAEAKLRSHERKFTEWWHKIYGEAYNELDEERTTKPTEKDITGRAIANNKKKYGKLMDRISNVKEEVGLLEVWHSAFRQKSFSSDLLVKLNVDEYYSKDNARAKVDDLFEGKKKRRRKK